MSADLTPALAASTPRPLSTPTPTATVTEDGDPVLTRSQCFSRWLQSLPQSYRQEARVLLGETGGNLKLFLGAFEEVTRTSVHTDELVNLLTRNGHTV